MDTVPVRIDRRTFYPDLDQVSEKVQDEAVRLIRLLEEHGPDYSELPILASRGPVYVCACTDTHRLHWIVSRDKPIVESVFSLKAKLVLVTRLVPAK